MKRVPSATVLACAVLGAAAVPASADSGAMTLIAKFKGNESLSNADVVRDELDGAAFHPTQNWLAVSDNSTTTRLYDLSLLPATPTVIRSFKHVPSYNYGTPSTRVQQASGEANPISFTPDGNWMVTGVDDNGAKVWNVGTGAQVQHLDTTANVDGAAFNFTGTHLAVGADSVLKVYSFNTTTGQANTTPVMSSNFGSGEVNYVDFSRDGNYLVGVGGVGSGKVRIFNTDDWSLKSEYNNSGTSNVSIKSVRFSPDSQLVAYGARDRRARVVDLNGNLVKDLPHASSHTYYSYDDNDSSPAVESLDWTADSKYLITGGLTDGIARIWRRSDWSLVGWVRGQDPGPDALSSPRRGRAIEAVHVDQNNRVVLTGDEGYAYVYQFNTPVEKGAITPAAGAPISIEAEDYDTNLAQGFITGTQTAQKWEALSDGGASGGAGLSVANAGILRGSNYQSYDPTVDAPKLDYIVDFAAAGTYYVWVRGKGDANGNSVHVGLNGGMISTGEKIEFGDDGSTGWMWTNLRDSIAGSYATLNIPSAGLHTLNLWMREDGVMIDKLLLTTDSSFNPALLNGGLGPIGSARVPEPATLSLAGVAAVSLLRRRACRTR
jgi:hypothetical protein